MVAPMPRELPSEGKKVLEITLFWPYFDPMLETQSGRGIDHVVLSS